jgi:hypothetical protein
MQINLWFLKDEDFVTGRSCFRTTPENPNNALNTYLFVPKKSIILYILLLNLRHYVYLIYVDNLRDVLLIKLLFYTNPPPPGGTAILPEYIHYYGYYYQVIVQCLST